ncbi:MAG: Membrane protein, partial [uncultured Blastococcus sp.]
GPAHHPVRDRPAHLRGRVHPQQRPRQAGRRRGGRSRDARLRGRDLPLPLVRPAAAVRQGSRGDRDRPRSAPADPARADLRRRRRPDRLLGRTARAVPEDARDAEAGEPGPHRAGPVHRQGQLAAGHRHRPDDAWPHRAPAPDHGQEGRQAGEEAGQGRCPGGPPLRAV